MVMEFCQLSFFYKTVLTISVCTEQNLISFLNFLVLFFFNLVIYLTSVHVHPFFYFPALVIGNFLKTFSGCCLGISKALLGPKQYGSGEE